MRKLALIALIFVFASFTNASAPSNDHIIYIASGHGYKTTAVKTVMDGMEFRVITSIAQMNSYDVETVVINITKEKLEVEKLKLEIIKLRK